MAKKKASRSSKRPEDTIVEQDMAEKLAEVVIALHTELARKVIRDSRVSSLCNQVQILLGPKRFINSEETFTNLYLAYWLLHVDVLGQAAHRRLDHQNALLARSFGIVSRARFKNSVNDLVARTDQGGILRQSNSSKTVFLSCCRTSPRLFNPATTPLQSSSGWHQSRKTSCKSTKASIGSMKESIEWHLGFKKKTGRTSLPELTSQRLQSILRFVFRCQRRQQNERAVPVANWDTVELHGEALLVVAPLPCVAERDPAPAIVRVRRADDIGDVTFFGLLTAPLRLAGLCVGVHCRLAFSRDVRVRGAGANHGGDRTHLRRDEEPHDWRREPSNLAGLPALSGATHSNAIPNPTRASPTPR